LSTLSLSKFVKIGKVIPKINEMVIATSCPEQFVTVSSVCAETANRGTQFFSVMLFIYIDENLRIIHEHNDSVHVCVYEYPIL